MYLLMSCDVLFCKGDVITVKHARKKEQWVFFLALGNKDLIVKVVLRPKKNFVFPLDFKTMLTKH